jgi:hypothetical protein
LGAGVSWSAARWQDLALTAQWLLDAYPSGQEQFLWDMVDLAHTQGNDWEAWFTTDEFPTGPVAAADCTLYTHGVNNAQAIKSGGVLWRLSNDPLDSLSSYVRMQKLDLYHGMWENCGRAQSGRGESSLGPDVPFS